MGDEMMKMPIESDESYEASMAVLKTRQTGTLHNLNWPDARTALVILSETNAKLEAELRQERERAKRSEAYAIEREKDLEQAVRLGLAHMESAQKAEQERDQLRHDLANAQHVRDLAREASNRDLEAKRAAERDAAEQRAVNAILSETVTRLEVEVRRANESFEHARSQRDKMLDACSPEMVARYTEGLECATEVKEAVTWNIVLFARQIWNAAKLPAEQQPQPSQEHRKLIDSILHDYGCDDLRDRPVADALAAALAGERA